MLLGDQGGPLTMSSPCAALVRASHARLAQGLLWPLAVVLCLSWSGAAGATLAGPLCGNGVLDLGETCDDGNADESDACLSDCQPATCGDGFVRSGVEQCDDGNAVQNDGCSTRCSVGYCGDGVLQSSDGEQCDDGNTIDGDGCSPECWRRDAGADGSAAAEGHGHV